MSPLFSVWISSHLLTASDWNTFLSHWSGILTMTNWICQVCPHILVKITVSLLTWRFLSSSVIFLSLGLEILFGIPQRLIVRFLLILFGEKNHFTEIIFLISAFVLLLYLIINNSSMLSPVVSTFISSILSPLLLIVALMPSFINLLRMFPLFRMQVNLLGFRIDFIICYNLSNDFPDILLVSKSFENESCSGEFSVGHAIIPTHNWHRIFWLKHISHWGIV